jgi:peptide chain release factor 1
MFDKLSAAEVRYEDLSKKLCDPDLINDNALYRDTMREYKNLTPLVEKYREYKSARAIEEESRAMLEEGISDKEFRELVESELDEAREKLSVISDELKILLLPKDPNDDRNVVMEIRGGAGGEEAALFAGVLFRMYSMYAERVGWKVEVVNANETELGGYKEISFLVNGESAYSKLKYESGVHRVQRIPVTESGGRIHTSTVTVSVLPEASEIDDIEIRPDDLEISTFRSSGPGGQNVNRTDSAVRIRHIPSGLVVASQQERSQIRNREIALRILKSRLLEIERNEEAAKQAASKRLQVGTGDRSERIRTYNFHESRVTDHRIGLTLYRIQDIMDGDLDEIVDALEQKLQPPQNP